MKWEGMMEWRGGEGMMEWREGEGKMEWGGRGGREGGLAVRMTI